MAGVPGGEYPAYDPAAVNEESEEDDYDPSNFVAAAAGSDQSSADITPTFDAAEAASNGSAEEPTPSIQDQNAATTNGAVKQPRTVGGFVVDDDDDEEEEETNGLNGSLSTAGTTQLAHTADNTLSTSEQSMSEKATQDTGVAAPSAHSTVAAAQPISTSSLRSPVAASSGTPLKMTAESSAPVSKARLPQDRVGILEDRIAEDPRGDVDAWLSLIAEYRSKNKIDDARKVYERFFQVFPSAAEQWVAYANMELEHDKFWEVEQIFKKTLMTIPHVQLWSVYLDYIRRINNLITDTTGKARQVVTQTYEFVLQNVGIDKDAGLIWQDYIKFLKSGPGTPGGSSWQDGQKMDSLRKAYQNAVRIPTQTVNALWTEYNTFETTLNKTTGRQLLNQQSPHFMTAKQQNVALEAIVSKINRTTIPRLPPLPGYEGYEKFAEQLNLWKKWIDYEKDDPLVLRDSDKKEEKEEYKKRVMYAYKQAFMALRFVPDVWCDAAEFCFANDMNKEGDEILIQGIEANPESCLLAFKRADRVELSTIGEADATKRGATVRAPYNTLLDALYALEKKITARGEKKVSEIKTTYTVEPMETEPNDDEDDEAIVTVSKEHKEAMEARVKAAQADTNAQIDLLKKTITAGWIALMRAIRRVQGKGKQGDEGTGMRQIFGEARKRGRLTSDFYIESGLLEHVCYQDPAGTKILERGVKLFPEDENIALVYIKHLISKHDTTNARATFETVVSKLTSKPENVHKARPLFLYFHDYESKFGELSQISKLEARMTALYPDDPKLQLFAHRFESIDAHDKIFDPTTVQHIISPATQAIPKALGGETTTLASVEVPAEKSPVPDMSYAFSNSPKRPYQHDESDNELYPPRKFQRGESPLKGAAGRRLAAAARTGSPSVSTEIPAAIKFILRLLPNSAASQPLASRIDINKLTTIMRGVDTSRPPPATLPVHPPLPPSLANAIQPPLQSPQQRTGSESWSQPPAPAPQTGYGQPYAVPPVPPSQPPTAANSYGVTPPLPVQTGQYGTPVPPPQPPSATAGYPGYPPPQPQYQQPHGQQPGQFPYPPPPQHNWQGPPSAGAYPPQGYQGYR